MGRGPGTVQRAILDHLHTSEPTVVTTTELAAAVLDRSDREAIRQVRRAVDGLAARGFVETWTGPAGDAATADHDERPLRRVYLRPTRRGAADCIGPGCDFCAAGDTPIPADGWYNRFTGERPTVSHLHMASWVDAPLSRVRWVTFAWQARPVEERRRLLERWIGEDRADLAARFPDGEPPEEPGFVAGMPHRQWRWIVERIAGHEAELADPPTP